MADCPKGVWRVATGRYASGYDYIIGKVTVAHVFFDGTRSRTDPKKYACVSLLPGQRKKSWYFEECDNAKATAEKAVSRWFSLLNEQPVTKPEREGV